MGLIEPYDLSKKDYSDDQRVAITHSSLTHVELGLFNPIFFEQMALTTRIVDADLAAQIRGVYNSNKNINARLEDVREQFCSYLIAEDARNCSVPERPEYANQLALRDDLYKQWKTTKFSTVELMHLPEVAAEDVMATVERFDHFRGFGFVDVPSLRD